MDRQHAAAVSVDPQMIPALTRTFAVLVLVFATTAAGAELPELALTVQGHKVTVEVAHTEPARRQGLMHRRMLPEQRGMLFVFDRIERHAMWMMNTYIPLSVAFIDAQGVIINIADMTPHTTNAHGATQPAKYALEVNQGWFRKRGIAPGARIEGIEKAPPAR
jgi:uncharacterized membrane protein (UPF0127 family)